MSELYDDFWFRYKTLGNWYLLGLTPSFWIDIESIILEYLGDQDAFIMALEGSGKHLRKSLYRRDIVSKAEYESKELSIYRVESGELSKIPDRTYYLEMSDAPSEFPSGNQSDLSNMYATSWEYGDRLVQLESRGHKLMIEAGEQHFVDIYTTDKKLIMRLFQERFKKFLRQTAGEIQLPPAENCQKLLDISSISSEVTKRDMTCEGGILKYVVITAQAYDPDLITEIAYRESDSQWTIGETSARPYVRPEKKLPEKKPLGRDFYLPLVVFIMLAVFYLIKWYYF